jgi:ParB/RepB/Spo0J family partition protein
MAKLRDLASGRKDIFMVDPKIIKVDPKWNVRINNDKLQKYIEELAESIAELGVLQPLTVRIVEDEIWVTDGFCRMAAVNLNLERGKEIANIPIRPEERYRNEADHVLSMLTRNKYNPLSSYEQALVVKRLLDYGWEKEDIRKKTGINASHMANLLLLLSAPPEIAKAIEQDRVSINLVLDELRNKEPHKAAEAIKKKLESKAAAGGGKVTNRKKKDSGPSISWKVHGKAFLKHLRAICEKNDALESVPDDLADLINEAKDVIEPHKDIAI